MVALQLAKSRLDAQRAAVDSIIENAGRSLSANAAPPICPDEAGG